MKRVSVSGGPKGFGRRSIVVRPEATGYGWKGQNLIVALRKEGEAPEMSRERVGKAHGLKIAPFDAEAGLDNGNPPSVGSENVGFDMYEFEVSNADLAHYTEEDAESEQLM